MVPTRRWRTGTWPDVTLLRPAHRVDLLGRLSAHQLSVSMKWPPSPVNREPSASSLRYQLSLASGPGVDQVPGRRGAARRTEALPHGRQQRGEAPVEADHEPVVAGLLDGLGDLVGLLAGQRQRLLDEDRLAGLQRPAYQLGMRGVPVTMKIASSDSSVEDGVRVRRRRGEAELLLRVDRAQRLGGGDVREVRGGQLGQVRQQHGGCVVPGADEADRHPVLRPRDSSEPCGVFAPSQHLLCRRGRGAFGRNRVLEQHADGLELAGLQVLVDLGRLGHREDPVDQRPDLKLVAGDQVEEGLQVPLLGPADVAGRVVDAFELVTGVVPAGPVGPGEPDVEFLLVVGVPRQVEPHLADVDDPGPVPGQLHGRLDRPVARAARGQGTHGRRRGRW